MTARAAPLPVRRRNTATVVFWMTARTAERSCKPLRVATATRHTLIGQRRPSIAQDLQDQTLTFSRPEPTLAAAPRAARDAAEVVCWREQADRRVQMAQLSRQPLQLPVTLLGLPGHLAPFRYQCAHYV